MHVFPDNTLAHFQTKLATTFQLEGEWEVGLAEISYPMSWYNLRREEDMEWRIRLEDGQVTSLSLLPGVYSTAERLLGEMKRLLLASGFDWALTVILNPISQKTEVYVAAGVEVLFSRPLAEVLGLEKLKTEVYLPQGAYPGRDTFDLHHGFYSLYVYCDLVRSRPIGDIMAPLLRSIPTKEANAKDKDGMNMRNEIFNNVYFLPMQKKAFQMVEVDIRDDLGVLVPFESGKVEVTLVFRRTL
jgi:hypothetical protein